MRILMYGWEFPPYMSGGLGVACYNIVNELARQNVHVSVILPRGQNITPKYPNIDIYGCEELGVTVDEKLNPKKIKFNTLLSPYITEEEYQRRLAEYGFNDKEKKTQSPYGINLLEEVYRYAIIAGSFAKIIPHDIIHTHDWLTMLAGIEARKHSQKPLITHVHALETDRCSPKTLNKNVFIIEKYGMNQVDQIVTVSNHTKKMATKNYDINPNKITVIHNGINCEDYKTKHIKKKHPTKTILFLGRITHQKGPLYFIEMAKNILKKRQDFQFLFVGNGDMMQTCIIQVARLGLGRKIHFLGFVDKNTANKAYAIADAYVMPSISEPFGLTALEAINHKVPVIISKQSGAAEVIDDAIKVNYWDTEEMAKQIISLMNDPARQQNLKKNAPKIIRELTWEKSIQKLIKVYKEHGSKNQ